MLCEPVVNRGRLRGDFVAEGAELFANDPKIRGSLNPKPHPIAVNPVDRHDDITANQNLFADLATENQHNSVLPEKVFVIGR